MVWKLFKINSLKVLRIKYNTNTNPIETKKLYYYSKLKGAYLYILSVKGW